MILYKQKKNIFVMILYKQKKYLFLCQKNKKYFVIKKKYNKKKCAF